MKVEVDLHTHTVASGHYTKDTVRMLALFAKEKGLDYLGITDHAKGMIGSAKDSYFNILKTLSPKSIYGVKMLYGVELNVLDECGNVDLSNEILNKLDYSIASLHKEVFKPSSEKANTNAILKAMDNKFVNIIGHADCSDYSVNFPLICEYAKETNTIIELNSASIEIDGYRNDSLLLCKSLIRECKKYGNYISLGSDSHGKEKVGSFKTSLEFLAEIDFPENKVVNFDVNNFLSIVNNKRNRK